MNTAIFTAKVDGNNHILNSDNVLPVMPNMCIPCCFRLGTFEKIRWIHMTTVI